MHLRLPNTCHLKFGLCYPHLHGIFILLVSDLDLYRACLSRNGCIMEYFPFKWSCFIMNDHSSCLNIFSSAWLNLIQESGLKNHQSSKSIRKDVISGAVINEKNIKILNITLYVAKRFMLTLKKLEYFHWQEIAPLRIMVFISTSRNIMNKAILLLIFLFTGLCTVYVYPQAIRNHYFSAYGVSVQATMTRTMKLKRSLARQKVYI